MKKFTVMTLIAAVLILVPSPVVPDEPVAAGGAAPDPGQQELEVFVPSQSVSADSSISFPVDI